MHNSLSYAQNFDSLQNVTLFTGIWVCDARHSKKICDERHTHFKFEQKLWTNFQTTVAMRPMKPEFTLVIEINWKLENRSKNVQNIDHYIFLRFPDFSIYSIFFQYLLFVLKQQGLDYQKWTTFLYKLCFSVFWYLFWEPRNDRSKVYPLWLDTRYVLFTLLLILKVCFRTWLWGSIAYVWKSFSKFSKPSQYLFVRVLLFCP